MQSGAGFCGRWTTLLSLSVCPVSDAVKPARVCGAAGAGDGAPRDQHQDHIAATNNMRDHGSARGDLGHSDGYPLLAESS
jgi:hypothetical protein